MTPRLSLPIDRVDLWHASVSEAGTPPRLAQYRELMEPHERAQADRFVFDKDRHEYTVARALVRTTLSRYLDRAPADWRFEKNRYGRPEIIPAPGEPRLRFNLTHTRGLVAVAVVLDRDIGVDAENLTRRDVGPSVADRYFSPSEVAELATVTSDARQRRFLEYWTLKESYIKARGMGLSLPLEQFSFHLSASNPTISFDPRLVDQPAAWQFRQFWLPEHLLAVALRREAGPDVEVQTRAVIPLAD